MFGITDNSVYLFLMVLGILGVICFFLVVFMLQRSYRKNSSSSFKSDISMQDVLSMKKKGLLTEEEAKAIREAVARQTRQKLEEQMVAGNGSNRPGVDEMLGAALAEAEAKRAQAHAPAQKPVVADEASEQSPDQRLSRAQIVDAKKSRESFDSLLLMFGAGSIWY